MIGLAVGAVWVWIARDNPSQHPQIKSWEVAEIEAGLPPFTGNSDAKSLPWRSILSSRNVLAVTLSYFCYGYVAYIFLTWFFIYLSTVRGLDLKASSYYGMLPPIAMAIGSPLGGLISDQLTRRYGKRVGRCGVACAGLALAAVFVALGTQAQEARIASIILAGGAGALYLSQSSFWSVTSDIGGRSAGSVSGVMNMGNQIGGAVTASLTPIIAKHLGWGSSFLFAAALCVVGALTWLLVKPEQEIVGGLARAEAVTTSNT